MNFVSVVRRVRQKLRDKRKRSSRRVLRILPSLFDMMLYHNVKNSQERAANPLNHFGRKCFSQSDEDGITLEVLRRLGCESDGTYAEFGVGNGMENNSLVLAALGWRGFWVGGEDLLPQIHLRPKSAANHFAYLKEWITLANIVALGDLGLQEIGREGRATVDVISLDLDGNDIYLVEAMLHAGFKPKLFIVEYNAKFPPPVEFAIAYDPGHVWKGDDYFGASLTSFVKLFASFGYKLVCCNAHSGANAFFVDESYRDKFQDVPGDIRDIYQEPRYWFYTQYGHPTSARTVEAILNRGLSSLS